MTTRDAYKRMLQQTITAHIKIYHSRAALRSWKEWGKAPKYTSLLSDDKKDWIRVGQLISAYGMEESDDGEPIIHVFARPICLN